MSLRSRRTSIGALLLAILGGTLLAGCGGDAAAPADVRGPVPETSAESPSPVSTPEPSALPGPDDVQYVALGDSYAAAPGVPETDQADGCFRSNRNYAHLLAEDTDLFLTDVTCSGATTDDVKQRQVPSLGPDTDLVTIGIGGNDFDLFTTILRSCLSLGGADVGGSPCTDALTDQVEQVGPGIADNIGTTLDAITAAAPAATVYVVGYPALLPESGTCPDLVPFAASDYPLLTRIISGLSDALRTAAEARGLPYVDVYTASIGHDVCSDDPWVNGVDFAADGTIPFHPLAVGQAAVADLISAML